jgi:hypothetical protein
VDLEWAPKPEPTGLLLAVVVVVFVDGLFKAPVPEGTDELLLLLVVVEPDVSDSSGNLMGARLSPSMLKILSQNHTSTFFFFLEKKRVKDKQIEFLEQQSKQRRRHSKGGREDDADVTERHLIDLLVLDHMDQMGGQEPQQGVVR